MATAKVKPAISYRPHNWINTKTLKPLYGIQAKIAGKRGWMHVMDGEKPVLFSRESVRDNVLRAYREEQGA